MGPQLQTRGRIVRIAARLVRQGGGIQGTEGGQDTPDPDTWILTLTTFNLLPKPNQGVL